jgi:hypothetical protein
MLGKIQVEFDVPFFFVEKSSLIKLKQNYFNYFVQLKRFKFGFIECFELISFVLAVLLRFKQYSFWHVLIIYYLFT